MNRYLPLVLICGIGCGIQPGTNPDPVSVSGTVKHGGQPVSDVDLNFQPAGSGTQPRVVTLKDGQFDVELNPGRYTYFFSEASAGSEQAKSAIKAIPDEYQEPAEDREIDVQPDVTLELEI